MGDNLPQHCSTNCGVDNLIQRPPLLLVIEYDGTQLLPVKSTLGSEDVCSKVLDDLRKSGCTRFDNFASDDIGVNDGYMFSCEELRDR